MKAIAFLKNKLYFFVIDSLIFRSEPKIADLTHNLGAFFAERAADGID